MMMIRIPSRSNFRAGLPSRLRSVVLLAGLLGTAQGARAEPVAERPAASPLAIGETFVIRSTALSEERRINVYFPPGFGPANPAHDEPLPVLYMPDGGLGEDFLHVAGLVQVSVGNGTMRPFLLVGIENTERRRDMTGPTENDQDRKIAPRVGGAAAFRKFIRSELIPEIRARYRTTAESAIVGESLAGLFVVETFLLEPDLFDRYIAFDPSLWWNDGRLLREAPELLRKTPRAGRSIFVASSGEPELARLAREFDQVLAAAGSTGIERTYRPLPDETHATIYHPAALAAFRALFAPPPAPR